MSQLFGGGAELGWVAVKALLLYLTAVVGFRFGERRALTEMTPFDFVAAVAVGAIVGRVPNADTTSYLAGAITLVTVLAAHRVIMRLRYLPRFAHFVNAAPRVLVTDGTVHDDQLKRCGLTRDDLDTHLRQRGIGELSAVRFVIFEPGGQVSVIRQTDTDNPLPDLVRIIAERPSR